MTYAEQLKKPQWQKKRLEILERDEWTCQMCEDTEATLTVHHKSYRFVDGKFSDVWDYDGEDLITLCDSCHSSEESKLSQAKKDVYLAVRDSFLCADDILCFAEYVRDIKASTGKRFTLAGLIKEIGDVAIFFNDQDKL